MATGLLLIRLAVGLALAAHGAQKLFGVLGGHGIAGTGGFFESMRFRPGRPFAVLAGLGELGGGVLLALGLLTPFAAASIASVMVTAIVTVHLRNGFFNTDGGYELPLLLALVPIGIAMTGPGAWSLDSAFDIAVRGWEWGAMAAGFALASSSVTLAMRRPEVIDLTDRDVSVGADAMAMAPDDEALAAPPDASQRRPAPRSATATRTATKAAPKPRKRTSR